MLEVPRWKWRHLSPKGKKQKSLRKSTLGVGLKIRRMQVASISPWKKLDWQRWGLNRKTNGYMHGLKNAIEIEVVVGSKRKLEMEDQEDNRGKRCRLLEGSTEEDFVMNWWVLLSKTTNNHKLLELEHLGLGKSWDISYITKCDLQKFPGSSLLIWDNTC